MRRDIFQAVADPTRRQIINLIAHKPLTPNGVAESFDMSRQGISKHLKILTECGIIIIVARGREHYCFIQPQKMEELGDWLESFRKIWENRFDNLDDLVVRMQNEIKNKAK